MGRGREYWVRQVAAWRRSGLTAAVYCQRQGIAHGSLRHWAWKVGQAGRGRGLVAVGHVGKAAGGGVAERPVEILVGGRFALRTWAGTAPEHLEMVLRVLEERA